MSEEQTPPAAPAASTTDYRAIRIENMRKLAALGHEPYGRAFERTATIDRIRELGAPLLAAHAAAQAAPAEAGSPDGQAPSCPQVRAAGRLLAIRKMGKTIFADLRDGTGRIQLFVNAKACGDDAFAAFQLLDLGDHVGCEGELFVTRTGELSIRIASWTLLAKALRQPPEKFHGLTDTEDRYRMRYVDLFTNPESRERFYKRSAILRETRRWLEARGFMEVETPILQPHAGGATAKPFTTHYNALDRDMFLRIAPELYLKRLIIGGFDKVFEIGRDFRNEGLDRTHNPEFTVLELYQAYGDRRSMMDVIEGLLPHLCDTVIGSRKVKYGEHELDFTPPYREVAYADLVKERRLHPALSRGRLRRPREGAHGRRLVRPAARRSAGARPRRRAAVRPGVGHAAAHARGLRQAHRADADPADVRHPRAARVRPAREGLPGRPHEGQRLRVRRRRPREQNDPFAQREAFQAQVDEDAESTDEDFVEALEYGMPPTGGLGLGMDRVVMMLTGTEVIRDVILFPQLKQVR